MTSEDLSKHVHVVVTLRVRPEAEARALEVFKAAVEATRQEPACLRYELFRALEDPHKFVLVEAWRDQAGLDAHLQLPHIKEVLGVVLPQILAAPLEMQVLAARG